MVNTSSEERTATILQLSTFAGALSRSHCRDAGVEESEDVLVAFASGFDVAISLFEASTGTVFDRLTAEARDRVVGYFSREAARTANGQIASFYSAWAQVIAAAYGKPP